MIIRRSFAAISRYRPRAFRPLFAAFISEPFLSLDWRHMRRLLQFRLITLMLLPVLLSVPLVYISMKLHARRRERACEAVILDQGGRAWHASDKGSGLAPRKARPVPSVLVPILGEDFFDCVVVVAPRFDASNRRSLEALQGLPHLRTLWLERTAITDDDLPQLGNNRKLESLFLQRTRITDRGLAALAQCSNLEEVDASDTLVTGLGLDALAGAKALRILWLSRCPVTDEGAVCLSYLHQVRHLCLNGTLVSDEALKNFSALNNLESLNLGHTRITGPGLPYLTSCRSLRHLHVHNTQLGDESIVCLEQLRQLEHLILKDTRITDAGVARLRKALPRCDIVR